MNCPSNLTVHELERMREERQQLLTEIQAERKELEELKSERKGLEENVFKLKMDKEQHTRHIRYFVSVYFVQTG